MVLSLLTMKGVKPAKPEIIVISGAFEWGKKLHRST